MKPIEFTKRIDAYLQLLSVAFDNASEADKERLSQSHKKLRAWRVMAIEKHKFLYPEFWRRISRPQKRQTTRDEIPF